MLKLIEVVVESRSKERETSINSMLQTRNEFDHGRSVEFVGVVDNVVEKVRCFGEIMKLLKWNDMVQ